MWETGDTAAAEHNIAAWSQLTSPGLLHSSPHPLSPASAVSTPPSNPRLFHQSCVDTGAVCAAAGAAARPRALRSVLDRGWRGADLLHRRTLCSPPGLETGAGTSSVIHIHLHTLTHTLVPAPPRHRASGAPPPAPPPPGCDTGRRKSEQEQQPVIISSYDGVSRGRGQIVT